MNSRMRGTLATALALACAVTLFAVDEGKVIYPAGGTRPDVPAAAPGGGLHTLTLVVGLALAGVGGWFVWRNRHRVPSGRDPQALSVDETRSLGNRQYLVVASHQGKRFLLGVCPGRINLLSALPDAEPKEDARK